MPVCALLNTVSIGQESRAYGRVCLCRPTSPRSGLRRMRPPAAGRPPELLTLPPSHYCERARWGLAHAGLPYQEVPLAAGLHAFTVRKLALLTTLPLLHTATEIVQGSDHILDWCGLAAADRDAEERLQSRIGPLVRSFSYAATMDGPHHADIRRILLAGVPSWQTAVTRAVWPGLRRLLVASLKVQARRLPELTEQLEAELDWFGQHLAGRETLGPAGFGRDDITAASLLAPLTHPTVVPLYRDVRYPAAVMDTLTRWNDGPALRWVTATYRFRR